MEDTLVMIFFIGMILILLLKVYNLLKEFKFYEMPFGAILFVSNLIFYLSNMQFHILNNTDLEQMSLLRIEGLFLGIVFILTIAELFKWLSTRNENRNRFNPDKQV